MLIFDKLVEGGGGARVIRGELRMSKLLATIASCSMLVSATAISTPALANGPSIEGMGYQCEYVFTEDADAYCYFQSMGECQQFVAYMRVNDDTFVPVSPRCEDAVAYGVPIGFPIRGKFDFRD